MDYKAILAEKDATIAEDKLLLAEANFQLAQLKLELDQLKKIIYGSKRERFISDIDIHQLSLFNPDPAEELIAPVEEQKQSISYERTAPKKHNGRNEFPSHLPVIEEVIEPEGGTEGLVRIGEEVTETLDYTRASVVRRRTVRPKYVKPAEGTIHIAKAPSKPFPKFMVEVTIMAYIWVSKFVDHIPFYRQILRFKREYQWEVADSTINEWFIACCTLLHPLYEKLKDSVLQSGYIQVDESPNKVLDRDHAKGIHLGYQWVYFSPEKKQVLYTYRKGRGEQGPKEMLSGYEGIVQCDGYKVYDKFKSKPGIQLAGCMAHARRKFVEALKEDKSKSEQALTLFQQLYAHERNCAGMNPSDRKNYRGQHTAPLLHELHEWLEKQINATTPKSKSGKAISYTLKQWVKLRTFLEDGRIEIDNNLIENKIRPLALGRKNYLFAGSHNAAERNAMMYSFMGTCHAHGIDPYKWLVNTLNKIQDTKLSDLESLLPCDDM